MDKKLAASKVAVLISFIVTLAVNVLANIIPFNGKYTGEILEIYPNLIAPAKYTFGIWGVIYLMLLAFTLYQMDLKKKNKHQIHSEVLFRTRIMFILSSISNSIWIFAWHYDFIALSVMLIITVLICSLFINHELSRETLSTQEKLLIRLPFSIYSGWVTIATVANFTVLLVSIRFRGFGLPEEYWSIIIMIITTAIITYRTIKIKDIVYCLTAIWGCIGIYVKHISVEGFAGQYQTLIYVLIGCIAFLAALSGYLFLQKRKHGI